MPLIKRFLVVDDNADGRSLLTRTLLRKFPQSLATECGDADTAILTAREEKLDAIIVHRDPERLIGAMEQSGFLRTGHGLDPQLVYDYVSSPYQPYLVDEFTFTRQWMIDTLARILDVQGPHAEVIEALNVPPSFVILDRVVWGVSAILGKLEVSAPFRAMLLEYVADGEPATDLGAAEAAWRAGATP